MLEHGAEAYVKSLRRLLAPKLRSNTATVRFRNLGFAVESPVTVDGTAPQRATVGTFARGLVSCFCRAASLLVTRALLGQKPPTVTRHVLKGVSGVIPSGRFTLVLGPPGSGKTSLLKALAGKLARPSAGGDFTGKCAAALRESRSASSKGPSELARARAVDSKVLLFKH